MKYICERVQSVRATCFSFWQNGISPNTLNIISHMQFSSYKHIFTLFLLVLLWIVSIALACLPGPMPLASGEVWHVLGVKLGLSDGAGLDLTTLLVVGDIRLARVVLALLCGGGLAVSGVALQGVLRNALADPFTLGISAGAACGASVALTFSGTVLAFFTSLGWMAMDFSGGLVSLCAFAGALLALCFTLLLSSDQSSLFGGGSFGQSQRESSILAGIAVATFLGALVALIKALNEESVTSIVFWIMGSFQGRGWDAVPLLLLSFVPGLALVVAHWRDLDVLALGQREAMQLGVPVGRVRFCVLLGASLMAAGCVAVSGIIAFVGLVVPHILRFLLGTGHARLLVGAWFGGGLVLLWADVLARTILSEGQELPVGVVMSLVGGPFFAYLVRRKTRGV